MESFTKVTGIVADFDRVNIDTDAIVPARFLKRIERGGWGDYLFFDWRFLPDGSPNPEFILNQPDYRDASILVVGRNFGSGSSREHAVWAIAQYGIRAVIAHRLADIFQKNSFENGLVPVLLPEDQVEAIMFRAQSTPGYRLSVDLERCEVWDENGFRAPFVVHSDPGTHDFRRSCLLLGRDEIALTLEHENRIEAFEANHTSG